MHYAISYPTRGVARTMAVVELPRERVAMPLLIGSRCACRAEFSPAGVSGGRGYAVQLDGESRYIGPEDPAKCPYCRRNLPTVADPSDGMPSREQDG